MTEIDRANIPEFEQRAEEFLDAIYNLSDSFPTTKFSAENFTKDKKESGEKLVQWYQDHGYFGLANTEKEELKKIKLDSKSQNVISISISENDHYTLEKLIGEIDILAFILDGKKAGGPLFTDLGSNIAEGYRFTANHKYIFTK